MSYTTGSADSYADLVNKIRAIAEAQGWVTKSASANAWMMSSADGTANYVWLHITDGSYPLIWNFPAFGPCLMVSNCQSINTGLSPVAQPGQDINNGLSNTRGTLLYFGIPGPFTKFYAFVTSQYIHVVIEAVAGAFGHILVGTLNKEGAVYQGGSYNGTSQYNRPVNTDAPTSDLSSGNGLSGAFATYPFCSRYPYYSTSRVRVENVDNIGNMNCDPFADIRNDGTEGSALGPWVNGNDTGYLTDHPDNGLIGASANELGGNTMMVPCSVYHNGAQKRLRYVGSIPDHAVCNMKFLAPGDTVTYGTDEWMVFPVFKKGTDVFNTTLNAGVAYRIRS